MTSPQGFHVARLEKVAVALHTVGFAVYAWLAGGKGPFMRASCNRGFYSEKKKEKTITLPDLARMWMHAWYWLGFGVGGYAAGQTDKCQLLVADVVPAARQHVYRQVSRGWPMKNDPVTGQAWITEEMCSEIYLPGEEYTFFEAHIAHKGSLAGAKVQALTLLDLFMDGETVDAAWQYFNDEQTAETTYTPFISADDEPANASFTGTL